MKPVPYSPFNRTYKYICLQNQLAHHQNKRKVRGLVDSNLSLDCVDLASTRRSRKSSAASSVMHESSFFSYASQLDKKVGGLKKEPLVIHKNSKVNKYLGREIGYENQRINKKISQTKCRVIPRANT